MKKISFIIVCMLIAASGITAGLLKGRKVNITTSPVAYSVSATSGLVDMFTRISIYNDGTEDIAVDINSSTNVLYAKYTNGTAALVAPKGVLSPNNYGAYPIGTEKITNVVLMSASGTQTVYIATY